MQWRIFILQLPAKISAVSHRKAGSHRKISVDEAVKLFTKNAAYASYTEDENGTIEVGKNADFVVLEKNIYEIDPDEIKATKVDMTVLGGEIVYERESRRIAAV